ncbi:hypothetical protein [[Clostridium] polysaccharolyticum]|uniref:hypothetical protein n=1 Tax=[Clostridium] polysaccharolyticum TaxID=29364 RepID=UPI00115F7A6C|nr:hypothetical protein [[Clostridium] polysaccharolyticum]
MKVKDNDIEDLEKILDLCRRDMEYAAVKATRILNNEKYIAIKKQLKESGKWNIRLIQLEEELEGIKLDII